MSLGCRFLWIVFLFLALSVGGCGSPPQEGGSVDTSVAALPPEAAFTSRTPTICVHSNAHGQNALVEVIGIHPVQLRQLAEAELDEAEWAGILAVFVDLGDARPDALPPVVGRYTVASGALRFSPRYGLTPGLDYRVVLSQRQLNKVAPLFLVPQVGDQAGSAPGDISSSPSRMWPLPPRSRPPPEGGDDIETTVRIRARPKVATTVVRQVYPTVDLLPENQLKFYLHFSAPMSQGEAYEHIHLVHSSGKEVDLPFLELDEELWDWEGTRFTLFIDPGRIKREVTPHEELGPVLTRGEVYTLKIAKDWLDAEANLLARPHAKTFRVGPPDFDPPDPNTWTIRLPRVGTRKPLTVTFPEPLDHALLERVVWVADSDGKELPGRIEVGTREELWTFTPGAPWRPGEHRLVALKTLEDLAGNGIGRPFEVDVFQKVTKRVDVKKVEVRISVASDVPE